MSDIEITIKVDNRKTINSQFDSAMGVAMSLVGELVEGYAKEKCPVDTGNLRNSINHKENQSGTEYISQIGTNVEYAEFVETGTSKTSAQPYLKPALANHTSQVKQLISKTVQGAFK